MNEGGTTGVEIPVVRRSRPARSLFSRQQMGGRTEGLTFFPLSRLRERGGPQAGVRAYHPNKTSPTTPATPTTYGSLSLR